MHKPELVAAMAQAAGISRGAAAAALDGLLEAIGASLRDGEPVQLVGFGTFSVRDRPARTGRNPRTGEAIEIAASRAPAFNASAALKAALRS